MSSSTGTWPEAAAAARKDVESCPSNWMAQDDADENGSESRPTSAKKGELAQLHRGKRCLEMKNEILKRAAAYFARDNIPSN